MARKTPKLAGSWWIKDKSSDTNSYYLTKWTSNGIVKSIKVSDMPHSLDADWRVDVNGKLHGFYNRNQIKSVLTKLKR